MTRAAKATILPIMRRPLLLAVVAAAAAWFTVQPARAALPYEGCFDKRNTIEDARPDLLLVGTTISIAATGANGRPTAFLVDVERVLIGHVTDPFWVGAEDGSHYPRFGLADRIVIARWADVTADPMEGTSDLSSCFWVVTDDGAITYDVSPAINGVQPARLGDLLGVLSRLPDSAMSADAPAPLTGIGVGLLLASLLLAGSVQFRETR